MSFNVKRNLDKRIYSGYRNYTLDVIKLLAAYLVVFIHVPFYGMFGEIVKLFARIAVPVFFMTSGYFCYEKDFKTIVRRLKKIVVILIFTSILYNLTNIILTFGSDGIEGVSAYLAGYRNFDKWLLLILLNVPFSATRLWFLLALIYVYLVQLLVNKLKISYNNILAVSLIGLILHMLIGNSSWICGVNLPDYICRNYLLFGYPFFGIGLVFKHHEKIIRDIDKKYFILSVVIGTLLSFLPLFFESNSQIGMGTIILVFVVFCVSLQKSDINYHPHILKICECSLGIYILHRPVTTILAKALSTAGLNSKVVLYNTLLPVLVCVVSTIVDLLIRKIEFGKLIDRS